MRKSLIILLVLLLLSVTVLAAGVEAIHSLRTDMTITETTLAGDPAAAEGLQVGVKLHLDYQLFWQTQYEAGAEPVPETANRFYAERQNDDVEIRHYLTLLTAGLNYGISGNIDLEGETDWGDPFMRDLRMLDPVRDVARRTEAGETNTEQLPLADYYEFFRLDIQSNIYHVYETGGAEVTGRLLEEIFPVPVPETLMVEATVSKDENGEVYEVYCSTISGEQEIRCSETCNDDAAFWLLTGTADFSQMPMGYGIYKMPLTWDSNGRLILSMESIENVYPLDAALAADYLLQISEAEDELYLFLDEGSQIRMTVLDCETMAVKQELMLNMDDIPSFWQEGQLLILWESSYEDESPMVVLERRDGQLRVWLENALYEISEYGYWHEPAICFDGEKLALATFYNPWNKASHRIVVYDQGGLLYAGHYEHNSDTLPEPLWTDYSESLTLRWQ